MLFLLCAWRQETCIEVIICKRYFPVVVSEVSIFCFLGKFSPLPIPPKHFSIKCMENMVRMKFNRRRKIYHLLWQDMYIFKKVSD